MNLDDLTGKLLVAPPNIIDKRFQNNVILVVKHGAGGAWGVSLNKPIANLDIAQVYDKFDINPIVTGKVYRGGPVNHSGIHVVHSSDYMNAMTVPVTSRISVSSNLDTLDDIARGYGPRNFRFVLGVCTWAPGQLEGEMRGEPPWSKDLSWLVTDATEELIFGSEDSDQWNDSVGVVASNTVRNWML